MSTPPDELVEFYDRTYTTDPASAQRGARWRARSARGQAEEQRQRCEHAT